MTKFNFYERFELKGHWYLPNSEIRVAGTLKYTENGIDLELFGSLKSEPIMTIDTENYAIVLGDCEGGVLITLMDGFEIQRQNSYILVTKLTFNKVLIGKHYSKKEDIIFYTAELSFSNLNDWIERNVFSQQINTNIEEKTATITHTSPDVVEIKIPSIDSVIKFSYNVLVQRGTNERSIKHEEIINLVPEKPQLIDWFETKIFDLQGLLSFLMNRTVQFKHLILRGEISNPRKGRESIHFVFGRKTSFEEKHIRADELFIPLFSIYSIKENVFNNWFDEKIEPAKKLYLDNIFHDEGDTIYSFGNLAKGLESVHRNIHGDKAKYLSDKEAQKIRRKIREAIKNDVSEILLEQYNAALAYAHHFEFEKRIIECFEQIDERVKQLIFCEHMMLHFANRVKKTRNFHTHYGKAQKGILDEGVPLLYVNGLLKLVLFYHLSKFLGLNDDLIYTSILQDVDLVDQLKVAQNIVMEDFESNTGINWT